MTEYPTPDTSPTTPEERKRGLNVLFVALLSMGMGQTLFSAILPPLAREMGMSEVQVGYIFSLSAVMWVVMSPVWGRLSDRIGRKPVILIGLTGYAISTGGFGLLVLLATKDILGLTLLAPALILVRAIFGTFGSGTMPASTAYVADRTSRTERSGGVARISAAFGVGTIIGPGIAGALLTFGQLTPFFAVAGFALAGALAVLFTLPERSRPVGSATKRRIKKSIGFFDKRVRTFIAVSLALSIGQSAVMQVTSFYFMDVLGFSTQEAGQFVSVGLMLMAGAALFAQMVIIQRFGASVQSLLRWGAFLAILSFVILIFGTSFSVLVTGLVVSGLGFGMLRPGLSATASLSVDPDEQGAVAGMLGSTGAVGHMLNPVIGMPLYQIYHQGPFVMSAVLMVLSLLTILLHPRFRQVNPDIEAEIDEEDEFDVTGQRG